MSCTPAATVNVESFPRITCPHCHHACERFAWVDGETVDVGEPGDPYVAHMLWGNCPACREELYSLEVTVISEVLRPSFE